MIADTSEDVLAGTDTFGGITGAFLADKAMEVVVMSLESTSPVAD
jgi:hypothetical protein